MIFKIINSIKKEGLQIKLLTYKQHSIDLLDLNILSKDQKTRFDSFRSSKRKLEYFYTRLLWQSFDEHQEIMYSSTGKPEIKNGFISISHSKNEIAISYSTNQPIGLDIEHYNPKISRIKDKFLSEFEQNNFDIENERIITTMWSIKEAVYKLFNVKGLSFKKDIVIMDIGDVNKVFVYIGDEKNELIFYRLTFDRFILTYCLSK